MPEPGSHSHPAMSSSGKAAIAPSCLSSECFDTLTKSCIKCSDLFEDNTTEPTLAPTLTSTFLIFGVPLVVGLILVLAAFCGFLACKVGKQRRKRKAADEEDKGDTYAALVSSFVSSLEKHQKRKRREKSSAETDLAIMESVGGTTQSPVARPENIDSGSPQPSQDPVMPEGDGALSPAPCLHIAGSLKMPGPPRKARAKQRPCCQGDADGDIVLLSAVYPRPEECNHSFPLPATELGATALVTTKTTQNCAREERV